jgi:hypothetical protein
MGTVPARVGGSITLGAPLTSDAQGRLVIAAAGQPILGRALQSASAADEYIEIMITREGKA